MVTFSFCFIFFASYAQKNEVFYAFKQDWSDVQNMQEATYFAHVIKENDTMYTIRYYQKEGPMVKLETFKDASYKIPNGLFLYYQPSGKLDSMGRCVDGLKNGNWEHYGDSSRSIITVEYDHGRFVKSTNRLTQKIYYEDGREEDIVKPIP